MKNPLIVKSLLLAAAVSMLCSGCVYRERVVYSQPPPAAVGGEVTVSGAPPAPMVETVTVSPGPAFIWIGGCWVWRGHWVWEHGRWAHPPHPGMVWRAHHYEYRHGVHVFIRGGWY